jgi:hypothetical protein
MAGFWDWLGAYQAQQQQQQANMPVDYNMMGGLGQNLLAAVQAAQNQGAGLGPQTLAQLQNSLGQGGGGGGGGGGSGWSGGGGRKKSGGGDSGNVWAGTAGGFLPWATWGETPWAGLGDEKKMASQAQQWMNTMLPWLQAANQAGQWGTEFDWRKLSDQWNQQFQQGQFDWQKQQDVWGQGFQEKALQQQAEDTAMQTFGRRWKPNTRWM